MQTQGSNPGPALPATPFKAAALTEEAARDVFRQYVFAENGGEPFCDRCGSTAVYTYKSRPIYKCKECERQFSLTSGTPFEYRKLPWKKVIYLMARFCDSPQGVSAYELAGDCEVEYRTAFTWAHRFRAEIAAAAEEVALEGEVEIDVAFFGGFIRPKNVAKLRTDRRKVPYKSEKRRGVVTLVERNGRIKTAVALSESHATDWVRKHTGKDQPLFLDEASGWSGVAQTRNVKQVNHDVAYATPDCNINLAESFNAALRRAERGVHHHISHNYLDFYAAETGWRQERPKRSREGRMSDLLSLTARRRSSPMRGYYQHRRRRLPMVWSEHQVGRKESKAPAANAKTDQFTVMTVADLLGDPQAVPDQPGVYAVLLDGGERLLDDLGLPRQPGDRLPWQEVGCDHVYTGEAGGIRSRLLDHLVGDVERSNLRQSLLSLRWSLASLDAGSPAGNLENMEADLTRMFQDRGVVAFRTCPLPGEVEAHLLGVYRSPLNVQRADPPVEVTRHLRRVRKTFRQDFREQWPKPARKPRRR